MSGTTADVWRAWSRARWNAELFRHYFVADGLDARPVRRISVGPEDLAHVAGESTSPEAVQEAFEAAMAVGCSPSELERRLSREAHERWVRRAGKGCEPPYVADLLFTCYAAGLVDEDTKDVGDFRERLRLLLRHDPALPEYRLEDLGQLWECFARWLTNRRAAGEPLRSLDLPTVGREVRIGYSKRLVFPLRRDRQVLIDLLAREGVGREPPVRDVLSLLARSADRFTLPFQEAVARARREYRDAHPHAELDVLWSAVRDAAVLAESVTPKSSIRYQLFAQLDEEFRGELVLMTTGLPRKVPRGLAIEPSSVRLGGYDHVVVATSGTNAGPAGAVSLMLREALDESLAGWERSVPGRVCAGGVLLFTTTEGGARELVAHRPDDERVWALVADRRMNLFLDLFPPAERPVVRASRYGGWQEVGPFDGAHLARIDTEPHAALAQLRCLQPTRVGIAIHLAGGVRVDGGYLAVRGVLPEVRVRLPDRPVDRVVVYALRPADDGGVRAEPVASLTPTLDDPTLFHFPLDCGEGWEGRHNLVAHRGQDVVAIRQLTFHARALGRPFLEPAEPSRWWIEGAAGDVVPAGDPAARAPWCDAIPEDIPARRRSHGRSGSVSPRSRLQAGALEADIAMPSECRIEDHEGMDRFVEWAAGLATVRRGLDEGELLDMTEACFHALDWGTRWDVLRAWAEVGALEPLTNRNWRGRTWYARTPRLVVVGTAPLVVALVGLAGWATRRRVERVLAAHHAQRLPARAFTCNVAPGAMWQLPDRGALDRAAAELDLGPIRHLADPLTLATSVAHVRRACVSERPAAGELRRTWDWGRSHFAQRPSASALGVTVEQWVRRDGPDYFVVRAAADAWWTPSRNWALLAAHEMASLHAFGASGDRMLLRTVAGGPYLPLPVARAIVLRSGVAPGPTTRRDGRPTYAYAFDAGTARDAVSAALWGGTGAPLDIERDVRWLLAATMQTGADRSPPHVAHPLVALPADLRRALAGRTDVPGAAELAARRIPVHFVPLVRRLLVRAE
jgi:hypothetical protein